MSDELAHELRVLARLMENKAPVTFTEQDAAHPREAADEIDRSRAALREILFEASTMQCASCCRE
jgi:hypothetical protein